MQPYNKFVTALQSCSNLFTTKLQPYEVAAILLQPRFFYMGSCMQVQVLTYVAIFKVHTLLKLSSLTKSNADISTYVCTWKLICTEQWIFIRLLKLFSINLSLLTTHEFTKNCLKFIPSIYHWDNKNVIHA